MSEPIAVTVDTFEDEVLNSEVRFWWTSGRRGVGRAGR